MITTDRLQLRTGEMVFIPAGEFTMGSDFPDAAACEKPCHMVHVAGYYMDVCLVTNELFARFCSETGYRTTAERTGIGDTFIDGTWCWVQGADWRHPFGPESSIAERMDHPVVLVTVRDAHSYCTWRSRKERRDFRLPTEAEWEKAARGTDGRRFPWGDVAVDAGGVLRARYREGEPAGTAPVGSFPEGASPYGIMDMAGNVWDWCLDTMDRGYYAHAPRYDVGGPLSLAGSNVFRGGSFLFPKEALAATARHANDLARPSVGIGFRTVAPLKSSSSIRMRLGLRQIAHILSMVRNRLANLRK